MALYDPATALKNREWRRFVRVKARIKSAEGWRDAAILNVSSRGLMVHCPCSPAPGRPVEIRSGDQAIHARVVWCKGQRIGLRSDSTLPVMNIVSLSQSPASVSVAPQPSDRRSRLRNADMLSHALWPRLLELGSILIMAGVVVSGFLSLGGGKVIASLSAISAVLPH